MKNGYSCMPVACQINRSNYTRLTSVATSARNWDGSSQPGLSPPSDHARSAHIISCILFSNCVRVGSKSSAHISSTSCNDPSTSLREYTGLKRRNDEPNELRSQLTDR
jgi:hypothetical protein